MTNTARLNELKDIVNLFYNDVIKIIEERIENNKNKIRRSEEKEENLENDIKNVEDQIRKINEEPKYHINDNINYHLLPKYYIIVDKLKKDIYYMNEELKALRKYNEDERRDLSLDYKKYLNDLEKYYKEQDEIKRSCLNQEMLRNETINYVDRRTIDEIRRINDDIFRRYLPNSN